MWAFPIGPLEITLGVVIGILLFGRRLPEVGRYLGGWFVETAHGTEPLSRYDPTPQGKWLLIAYALIALAFLSLAIFWIIKATAAST